MAPILAALLAVAAPQLGGGSETIFELPGRSLAPATGSALAPFSDQDGDGIDDYLVGADGAAFVTSGADGLILLELRMPGVASFGTSLSRAGDIDGDGIEDVLVGAPLASPGGVFEAGSAYLFSGAGGLLIHEWHGSEYGQLGKSLSPMTDIDGDGTSDVVVGAPQAGWWRGRVHFYSGATGLELNVMTGPTGGSQLGADLALAGDVDGDGVSDLVIGAPAYQDQAQTIFGALFIHSGADGSLIRLIGQPAGGWMPSLTFGASFDLCGDMDGDGVQEVVLALSDSSWGGWLGQGRAPVYSLATGALLHDFAGSQDMQFFGSAVAGVGDVDLDGKGDVAVLSRRRIEVDLYSGTGALIDRFSLAGFLLDAVAGGSDLDLDGTPDLVVAAATSNLVAAVSGTTRLELHRLTRDSSSAHGSSLAQLGDLDGDGIGEIAVGDPGAGPGSWQGAITVYSGADGSELMVVRGAGDRAALGTTVLGMGDLDGDGTVDFLAGAPGWTVADVGVVTAFSGSTGALLHQATGLVGGRFGQSLARLSDQDSDGIDDYLVGEPNADAVEVRSGADGSLIQRIPGPQSGAFGSAVAAADLDQDGVRDLIVGAPFARPWNPNWRSGSVYALSGEDYSVLFLAHGPNFKDAQLGSAVAAAGDVDRDGGEDLIAGAPGAGGGFLNRGTATVWSGATGAVLQHFDGQDQDKYIGNAVSSAGDIDRDGHADLLLGSDGQGILLHSGATGAILLQQSGKTVSGLEDLDGDGAPEIGIGAPYQGGSTPNDARVVSFAPYLRTDSYAVGLAAGGQLGLDLAFPAAFALQDYKVLVSTSGNGPGPFGVPLTVDAVARESFLGNYPFPSQGMQGALDAQAEAQASIDIPGGLPPGLLGLRFWLAAVVLSPAQEVEASSVALPFLIGP